MKALLTKFPGVGRRAQTDRTETSPLLGEREYWGYRALAPEVEPMQRRDIVHGSNTIHQAFLKDSMMNYFASADIAPFREARVRAQYALLMHDAIRKKRMLTVRRGDAVMRYGAPGADNGLGRVHAFLTRLIDAVDSKELAKRKKEMNEKVGAMVADALGARAADMYEVQSLATAPAAQGKGYGSALVTAVTDMGDADGHDVWLITGDARPFYELLGCTVLRTATLGDDNPKWDGAPVNMYLMYRPAKTAARASDEKVGLEVV